MYERINFGRKSENRMLKSRNQIGEQRNGLNRYGADGTSLVCSNYTRTLRMDKKYSLVEAAEVEAAEVD